MRARYPDAEGYIERDGTKVGYEVFGDAEHTILLLATWSIIPSRHWRAQVPYLARHFRVVTFDGRGSGRSDRPPDTAAYSPTEFTADIVAVLDATGTDRAVLVALSRALWAVQTAACRPERVRAHRERGGRARPALLPGVAADGRDPRRQHHASTTS